MTEAAVFTPSDLPVAKPSKPLEASLRDYLHTHANSVVRIRKPVGLRDIGALSAQTDDPILFENVIEAPGFRVADILVKNRENQARALGVSREDYLKTLAYRLRLPPRPLVKVSGGPVKEVRWLGVDADLTRLPIPFHKEGDAQPYITLANIIRDPETGFLNSNHAGTTVTGRHSGAISFATPHSIRIMNKYRQMGETRMPIVMMGGVPPAYEIMANYSGLHLDLWGEFDMIGTIMDRDIEVADAETVPLPVPTQAEVIIEGYVHFASQKVGAVTSPSMYHLPQHEHVPTLEVTAITMREDRPIYRNHQTCPATDHQTLPRLCHEAILYNRLSEMGLAVKDVRFPTWGAALSCIIQFDYRHDGFVNDALMMVMGAPWINTKLVIAVSPDTDLDDPADVYHAIATRCDPERDTFVVPRTRGSLYDPSATPLPAEFYPYRVVGKMGIDATIKSRHDRNDFKRAWPMNWGKVKLLDFL
ncbi:UbiD family decarboxylase [Bradyrhizobium sp. JR4.1]|uniref:UbiD family decarboxylase n=1 Tax=Bradyrhizobium sp. JR4.1 TaxID=3156372 RepID=UPI0033971B70